MNRPAVEITEASQCPLCGQPNDCQLCTLAADKGACWCTKVTIPEELLAHVPETLKDKNCICRMCVMAFHRAKNAGATPLKILPGDFYFTGGLMVFTATYHLRRGYCCGSGCRHCPYQSSSPAASTPGKE